MQPQSPVQLNIRSDVFTPGSPACRLDFKISFHDHEGQPETAGGKSQADLLQITFPHTKKIPAEVEEYIVNNLGTFELTETPDGTSKTLAFELKINDIDSEKILRTYDDFFNKRLGPAFLELSFEKSGSFDDFFADLKGFYQVPILMQVLERGSLSVRMSGHNGLVEGLVQFLKSQAMLQLANFVRGAQVVTSLRGDVELGSYKTGLDKGLKELSLDQRDLMKEFFLAFENPLVRFIFEAGQEGGLHIRGRILNIMNYEVRFEGKGAAEFLQKIRTTP